MYRFVLAGGVLALGACLGCESLDPTPDLDAAQALIQQRSDIAGAWTADGSLPEDDTPLTLDRATRRALSAHPRIRAEIARVAEARADLVQAGLLPNPVLQAGYGFNLGGASSPVAGALVQSLAALWERPARVEAAEADLRVRVLGLSDAALRLVADVRTRFAEVLHGQRRADIDGQLVELRQRQLDIVNELQEVGEMDRRGVNAVRLARAQARDRAVRSAEMLAVARRHLAERIGVEDLGSLDDALIEIEDIPSEDRVLELVADQRLDVAAAFVALDGSHARQRLARWGQVPRVGAGVGYEQNFMRQDALFPRLELEIPIFDPGRAAVAKARAIETRTVAEADGLLWQACLEARIAHVAWISARERLLRLELDWIPAARENVEIAREFHEAGELTLPEVLEEEARLLRVERERNEIILDAYRAYFELERAVGGKVTS